MRFAVAVSLAALVVFAPAVKAESCFCGTASASAANASDSNCCCGDAASCPCTGCQHNSSTGNENERGDALSGCVCTNTTPQANPDQDETVVLADALACTIFSVPELRWPTLVFATLPEGDLGPPTYRPLLI